MSNLTTTSSVLNTFLAANADIVVAAGNLSITGCPTINYNGILSMTLAGSLVGQAQVTIVTPTAANSTTYTLQVVQFNKAIGRNVSVPLTYTTASSGDTATTICNALRAQLLAQTGLQITGSGSATFILTGNAGYELFTVTNIGPATTTVDTTTGMALTPTIASNTTVTSANGGTVITFSAPHGLVIGSVITIVSADETKIVSGTYRVYTVPLSTTVTVGSLTGSIPLGGTSTTTATASLVAQYALGQGADLIAAGITTAVTGSTYDKAVFVYKNYDGTLLGNTESSQHQHTLWARETSTSDTLQTNFDDFHERLIEVQQAFVSEGTTSDPELIAKI